MRTVYLVLDLYNLVSLHGSYSRTTAEECVKTQSPTKRTFLVECDESSVAAWLAIYSPLPVN